MWRCLCSALPLCCYRYSLSSHFFSTLALMRQSIGRERFNFEKDTDLLRAVIFRIELWFDENTVCICNWWAWSSLGWLRPPELGQEEPIREKFWPNSCAHDLDLEQLSGVLEIGVHVVAGLVDGGGPHRAVPAAGRAHEAERLWRHHRVDRGKLFSIEVFKEVKSIASYLTCWFFCSNCLWLYFTRWVRLTLSSLCPLF